MIPKISILICSYNSSKYLERCLNSVINQTYENIEIICVDDCSTDKTPQILNKYKKIDKRVTFLRNSRNMGIPYNRNLLINASHGEYFFFLDSDDWMPKNACKNFVKFTKGKDYDIAVGRVKTVFENHEHFKFKFFPTSSFKRKTNNIEYAKKNILLCWGCFINRYYWNSLNVKFNDKTAKIFEDLGLMPYVFLNAKSFLTIPRTIYYYFRRKGSTSKLEGKNFDAINDMLAQIDYLLNLFEKTKLIEQKEYREAIISSLYASMGFILFFNFTKSRDSKLIYEKIKLEYILLITKKHKLNDISILNLRIAGSWWKKLLTPAFRLKYRRQYRIIKKLESV